MPTDIAMKNGRSYITPEDVADSYKTDVETLEVWRDILKHLGEKTVEDWSSVAFVAYDGRNR